MNISHIGMVKQLKLSWSSFWFSMQHFQFLIVAKTFYHPKGKASSETPWQLPLAHPSSCRYFITRKSSPEISLWPPPMTSCFTVVLFMIGDTISHNEQLYYVWDFSAERHSSKIIALKTIVSWVPIKGNSEWVAMCFLTASSSEEKWKFSLLLHFLSLLDLGNPCLIRTPCIIIIFGFYFKRWELMGHIIFESQMTTTFFWLIRFNNWGMVSIIIFRFSVWSVKMYSYGRLWKSLNCIKLSNSESGIMVLE